MQSPKPSFIQNLQLVFLGVIAFSTGGILVWLLLPHAKMENKNALPSANSFIAGADLPKAQPQMPQNIPEHQTAPDVSGMSPSEAAMRHGNWSFDNKIWSQAITEYQKAIALGLNNADLHTDLGTAYRYSGDIQKAVQEYQKAQQLDPQHQNSLFNLATLYLENLHQPGLAAELLKRFADRYPNSDALPKVRELLQAATKSR
jgi:tetratricopeptide (TPR) repeat protein